MAMKNSFSVLVALTLLGSVAAFAQPGPGPALHGPRFGGALDKLFGDNQAYSATMKMQTKETASGDTITMPGKLAYDSGKSRFEMNMSEVSGAKMPPGGAEQLKQMGMDTVIVIGRPDQKLSYQVYPGMQSFVQTTPPENENAGAASDAKVESTELGKETVDGHPCIKTKTTVTTKDGEKHEYTTWQATDLKKFPIKIEMNDGGAVATMMFSDVKFAKPDASLFTPPADYTKYDNQMDMMREQMMKRMGPGMMGMPPHH
ncbi:MAG TPA: hypothetical protein VFV81_03770 [Verrucomicrobiae bacterium]|nr:hypothetical protein [Verrucomicrobiae bacterium]